MSAFIVSQEHIDYLVRCAVEINRGKCPTMYWDHVPVSISNATIIGQSLWRANIASVAKRYEDHAYNDLPGPRPVPVATDYRYQPFLRAYRFEPVQLIKAIQCYEHQSNEREEWAESEARKFCECLTCEAIARLPGYDEAEWEVSAA